MLNEGFEDTLLFHTTITFPEIKGKNGSLVVKRLETDVFNTAHKTTHLGEGLFFEKFKLRSSNGAVGVLVSLTFD